MKVNLAYGSGTLAVEFPDERTTVVAPRHVPGLPDERAAVRAALQQPIQAAPLAHWTRPDSRVCIVFSDLTRLTPNERLIPWLLEELTHIPPDNITLLNSTGTHRPNTRAELEKLLTPAVVARYRVLNHDCENPADLVAVGTLRDGTPALLNRHLVTADVRIITGFIEPHFFAGFSGGPKGIMPGVAGLQTVLHNHGPANISDPRATFGMTTGNPLWEELRDIALRVGKSFLLNVSLNAHRQITGVFAGDLIAAHQAGTEFVRRSAMCEVAEPFAVVVSTNGGYPLDLNLYQTVKGMSAGARILQPGGTLIVAAECREGVPTGSPFEKLLRRAASPAQVLQSITSSTTVQPEQWQAQIQARLQQTATVHLHSSLPAETVRALHLQPCADVGALVRQSLAEFGPTARVAVLPHGPLTIPYQATPN